MTFIDLFLISGLFLSLFLAAEEPRRKDAAPWLLTAIGFSLLVGM